MRELGACHRSACKFIQYAVGPFPRKLSKRENHAHLSEQAQLFGQEWETAVALDWSRLVSGWGAPNYGGDEGIVQVQAIIHGL